MTISEALASPKGKTLEFKRDLSSPEPQIVELSKQIKRLLALDFIEMTLPDKPNNRLQKYRLTA